MTRFARTMVLGALVLAACGARQGDGDEGKKRLEEINAGFDNINKALKPHLESKPPPRPRADANVVYDIPIASSPVRGPKRAKVTITEFSDFQCPFCAQSVSLVEEVLKAYPNDVNFVFKQFPLPASMHPNAMPAAKASVAAGRQGKFWEMHDTLFQNNRELSFEQLKAHAGKIGLDVERWEKDFHSPEVEQEIRRDMASGRAARVDGTPTFFVNGKRLANRSFDDLKAMIEAELKAKGGDRQAS